MDPKLEIRKLPPSIVRELGIILDYADSWKRLMAIIPARLKDTTFVADVKPENLPKYHSDDFKIIEQAGTKFRRSCTEILLDEWGTSGKIRANLGHLKYLLAKAELFRAADYVAQLLNEEPPARPLTGPAAPIRVDLTSKEVPPIEPVTESVHGSNVEEAIVAIRRQSQEPVSPVTVIPQIVVSEIVTNPNQSFNPPIVIQVDKKSTSLPSSDASTNSEILPNLSVLLEKEQQQHSFVSGNIPPISDLLIDNVHSSPETTINTTTEFSEPFIPALSKILNVHSSTSEQSSSIPAFSQILNQEANAVTSELLPNLTALNISSISSASNITPDIDNLLTHTSQSSILIPETVCGQQELPNLSLTTDLPHFTYSELERTTNSFNNATFTDLDSEGRLLGSGGFGSVYLAVGLLGRLLAVKRVNMEWFIEADESENATKQFRNEVEFHCKYKHRNLVPLVGYSCDGFAYCLIYDFISGGNLQNLLKTNPEKLSWQNRIEIAVKIAETIVYLHTAYSRPLIHRDIKSANILLDENCEPKLCDFGIVKLLPSHDADLQTAPLGTSAYMSPEYHRGNVSTKVDCYSFGVVILELLSSKPVIDENREGKDLVTFVEMVCEDSVEPLLDRKIGTWKHNDTDFSEKLFNLALKCIHPSVSVRPEITFVLNELKNIADLLH